jgi:hypothetical protein
MTKLVDLRKWLAADESPSMRYVIELYDGSKGEAETALTLFDLLCDQAYSDTDDRESQIIELAQKLKDVAAYDLGAMAIRAQVYSGVGLFFDNGDGKHQDDREETAGIVFKNTDPVILDFWDEWTTIASLIKCGYLKLFVRNETLSEDEEKQLIRSLGIFENMPGVPTEEAPEGYLQVTPEQVAQEPGWKQHYIPLARRG